VYSFVHICWQEYAESKVGGLEDQLSRMKVQVDELSRSKDELTQQRNKLTQENSDFQRQIHDLELNLDSFSKNKSQAQQKLESTQSKLEEEVRVIYPYLFMQIFGLFCYFWLSLIFGSWRCLVLCFDLNLTSRSCMYELVN